MAPNHASEVSINQNSVEVSQNAKGERSFSVKIYFGDTDLDETLMQTKIKRLCDWFVNNIKN